MPIKTKNLSDIAEKFVRKAQGAAQDYKAGVTSPSKDWQAETTAAAPSYVAGVTAAIGRNAFQNGVSNAGTAKWQRNAINKGAVRYGPGVAAAKDDYQKGFAPFLSIIQGLNLSPRGPKGDPANYNRSAEVGQALHAAKVGG